MTKPQDLLNQASRLHQSGQIQEAIKLYVQILPRQKNNPQLLYLLGTANVQIGQYEQGIELLKRSLLLNPYNAFAHNNRGNALKELKRLDEALVSYNKALAIKPEYAEAYNNRGTALQDLKRLDQALVSYDKALAIKPEYAEAYNNRGAALQELKRLDEALVSYDKALAFHPEYAEAYNNRGNALKELKRFDEALVSYDKALAFRPEYAEAYNNRGNALKELKRFDEALVSYDKVLAFHPEYADAYNNRGTALHELKRLDEALVSYDKALAIKPEYAEAYNNRGAALHELKRLDEALVSYDKALEINPKYADAYNNRGTALKELKRLDEALVSYDKALAVNPEYADAYWNKSVLLILMGRYLEGWELYEWRLKKDETKDDPAFPKLAWRGQRDIQGKRLLIQAEQGLGDVIQFCRYVHQIKLLGAEILLEVPESLVSLVSTLTCPMTVVAKGTTLPEFDAYCPIMSLPYSFKTTLETIPSVTPYLSSDARKVQKWKARLRHEHRLKVGLVWSGSEKHKNDISRSIRLEDLLPLTDLPAEWHSLQKDIRGHDAEKLRQHPEIHQHQSELNDFSDTAALIQCLDLVISVDTSVAHVAGALGKPVWILLPFLPDYRWLLDREDSPWYPSARLFRQPKIGDWRSVVEMLRRVLEERV